MPSSPDHKAPQRQDSLTDQLRDLDGLACKYGMYDASEFLRRHLQRPPDKAPSDEAALLSLEAEREKWRQDVEVVREVRDKAMDRCAAVEALLADEREARGDRLLYDCQRSSAVYVERCDDCPGCRQVEQSTKAALRRRAEKAEAALLVAADDLDKAANQFASMRESQKAGHFSEIHTNPEKFAAKAARARSSLGSPEEADRG